MSAGAGQGGPSTMLSAACKAWLDELIESWNRFWFQPLAPHTLCAIRVLAGAMLLYTHAVWTIGLEDFLGPNAWLDRHTARELGGQYYVWSPLFHFDNPTALWTYHVMSLAVMFAFMIGWRTRETSVLAWLFAVSYCHRLQGALFGLDQVNAMLAMYLMLAPSGAVYSLDHWLAKRRLRSSTGPNQDLREQVESRARPSTAINVATRLIQVHLSVIYLFGAFGKMKGDMWWDGSAVWFAIANLEYQSFDMTWMSRFPFLIALASHVTLFWELSYCALVWPKRTRPFMIGMAIAVHGGIAFCLGMITFGMAMIFANLAFVSPAATERIPAWLRGRLRQSA